MKYIKMYNESIKSKDIQETIDEILDNLSKKSKLSILELIYELCPEYKPKISIDDDF